MLSTTFVNYFSCFSNTDVDKIQPDLNPLSFVRHLQQKYFSRWLGLVRTAAVAAATAAYSWEPHRRISESRRRLSLLGQKTRGGGGWRGFRAEEEEEEESEKEEEWSEIESDISNEEDKTAEEDEDGMDSFISEE